MPELLELPTAADAAQADKALRTLAGALAHDRDTTITVSADGVASDRVTVPRRAFALFLELLGQMANGNAVTLIPVHAELTTQQAADLLNVSRPFVVKLLETGELPFHRVGSHRRIRAEHLFAYRRQRDRRSSEALAALARAGQELGLE